MLTILQNRQHWLPSPILENWQVGTRAWWTRVPCEVPESSKLGYQPANFQNCQRGTQANFQNWQVGTRASWTRVPCEVPESRKLGYQPANMTGYNVDNFETFWKLAGWYPSLVDSGTSQGTRVQQARVPTCQFSKIGLGKPMLTILQNCQHWYPVLFFSELLLGCTC